MCCGTSSLWVRFALVLIIIGLIFETVGFATATWMFNNTNGETRIGLWTSQICSGSVCTDSEVPSSFCIVPGALLGAGLIVWMVYVQSQVAFSAGYSMGLTILGGVLAVFAGLLFIPETGEDYEFEDRVVKARGTTPQYSRHHSSRRVNVRSISPSDDSSRGSTPDYYSTRQTRKTYDSMPSPMETPKTYDSMPVPMSQTVYNDGVSTGRNFRPPTYNDVSAVTLQRDRVGI